MNYEAIALWSQVLSAIFMVVVLIWVWARFIQPAVMSAQAAGNEQIAQAERRRDESKAHLDALQGEMESARADALAIKARADADAKRELDATVAQARDEGERTLRNARGELERALSSARRRLRLELGEKAFAVAREDARRRIDASVDQRLINDFVTSLDGDRG